VAWNLVQRPLCLGGLGIPDLKFMGMSLRLHWLWLQRCDKSRPWSGLLVVVDRISSVFFRASTTYVVGDGKETLFWADPWLDGRCLEEWAPDLTAAVEKRRRNRRSVAEALDNGAWIKDIIDTLSIPTIVQYLHLRARVNGVQLQPGVNDKTVWKWTSSGTYTASSAYAALFHGQTTMVGAREVWRVRAP
jgi:hypothetical protein